ncbi:MAG: beta strand repeat-containing protein, partial [Pseudomonadota bacterium]
AEVGATYSYTISSSGGGTNVTGSGTVGSAGAQISNINVGGLNDGTLTLSVVLTDTAGNASAAVTDTATLDATAPTVAISSGATNPTNAAFQATVSFSEIMTGFVLGDIVASNASLSNLIDNNDGDFIVTVTPTADGAVTLNVAANVAQDAAGNNNTVAIQYSTVFDSSGPVFSSSTPADNATTVQYNANVVLTFNENVSVGAGNISIYDAADDSLHESVAIGSASISGAGVTVNPSANFIPGHTYYVNADAGLVEDVLGNGFAGFSDETTLNFTVTNNVPTAAADSETTNEDNAVSISVLANDSDVDSSLNPASVTVVAQPAHGTTSVNTGTGVITFTPTANYNGSDSFTYTVGDTHGGTSSAATVSLTITAVNDNPVAVADVESTPEDQPISIDVAANDTDVDTGDAADADSITLVSQPTNGTAAVSNGEVLYTPDGNFFGSDSFTYQIQDQNSANSNVATVIVNVSGVNDAPTAANDSASTDEDTAVTIDLVDNDTDVDGTVDATAVTVMAQPAHGTVSINATTGVATFTPTANYFGSDSFTYVVQDNEDATSATGTVSITIASVNDAPVAANDTVSLQEDTAHDINALGNDSDVDGTLAAASVQVVTAPVNGTTSVSGAGVITYTPGNDFNGSDSLTYRVQDNLGVWSAVATVAITVQSVNDEPLANDDSAQTDEDTAVIIDLLDNDADVDGTLDTASISIVSAAASGSLTDNGDGTVTYTPAADTNGSDSFTYSVSDNQAGVSNTATVLIDVQAVNDAPVISGSPTTELLEGEAYSFVPVITDVDNVSVTVTATNLPGWLILDAGTGELSGTPAVGDAGDYADIELSVSDGTVSTPLAAFSISVLGDNDTDGTDNAADTDDDNDGMGDTYEQTYGFNPLDDSDAAGDLDGDTISNLQESLDGTAPNDNSDYYDVTAPVVSAPDDLVIDAVALYTPVTLQQLLGLADDATSNEIATALGAIASDNVDGSACCGTEVVGVLNGSVLLAPGANLVTYEAVDAKGNVGTATQTVNVRPLVSVNKDQISVEGASVQFRVILNGQSPFYPLEVPFVIDDASTADDTDHDLVNGSVVFTEAGGVGQTEAVVTIQLTSDVATEADEVLIVRLDDQTSNDEDLANGYDEDDIFDINGGAKTSHVITITEQNVAPDVVLQLSQNGVNTIQVTSDGGPVTLTASATDPNTGDSLDLDWSDSDNTLVDSDGDLTDATLVFDPSALSEGRYLAQVTVTDSEGATDTATLYFLVVAALPDLSDQEDTDGDGVDDETEGTADSDDDGIPDYQDNITAPNVLPEVGDQTESYLVECDPGVRCRLGQFALLGSTGGVRLEAEDFDQQDDLETDAAFAFNGGIFDFEVHDLPTVGQSVRIVLPQANPIPQQAVYRKYLNGSWRTFVENANNAIHSAPGNPGYCPPPGDASWQPGLNVGDHCVQLTLEDGGPNDGDGVANAAIEDPGGVAVQALVDDDVEQTFSGIKSKGKGGGGSLGVIALLMLAGLLAARPGKAATAKAASLGAALLVTTAFSLLPAQSGHAAGTEDLQQQILARSYISVSFYQARGSQGSGDFEQGAAADGVVVSLNDYEESRTAWQIATGYRYLDWSAVELGYLDLGETQVDLDATGTANNLEAAMSDNYPVTGHGWTLANRFLWEAMPRVTLSGEVGLFIWEGEIDLTGANVEPDLDDGTDLLLGVACAYRITDQLEAALHLKRVFFDDQEVDLPGVEGRFHF